MITLHPEFVVDNKAERKAVLLPLADWNRLMEEIEELDDIRAYDKATSRSEKSIPFDEAVRMIKSKAKK